MITRPSKLDNHALETVWRTVYMDLLTLMVVFMTIMIGYEGDLMLETQGEPGLDSTPRGTICINDPDCGGNAWADAPPEPVTEQRVSALARRLKEIGLNRFGASAGIYREDGQVTVELNESILFETGRADLKGTGLAVVRKMAPALNVPDIEISIEGHTDSRPIVSALYPSNWELSAARAAAVARTLIDGGIAPGRIGIAGRAATVPIGDNRTSSGRQKNRRVAIIVQFGEDK